MVAQSFSKFIKGAAEGIEYVDLVTYACYDPDILHLDGIETPDKKLVSSVVGESGEAEVYDKNYHFSLTRSSEVREKAELLRKKIIELPHVEEILGHMNGIAC